MSTSTIALIRQQFVKRKTEMGLSTNALAKKAGITPLSITSFEAGKSVPSIYTLEKLAVALEMELNISFSEQASTAEAPAAPAAAPQKAQDTQCSYCHGNQAVLYSTSSPSKGSAALFIDSAGFMDAFDSNKRLLNGWVPYCPMCGRPFQPIKDENVEKYKNLMAQKK